MGHSDIEFYSNEPIKKIWLFINLFEYNNIQSWSHHSTLF